MPWVHLPLDSRLRPRDLPYELITDKLSVMEHYVVPTLINELFSARDNSKVEQAKASLSSLIQALQIQVNSLMLNFCSLLSFRSLVHRLT